LHRIHRSNAFVQWPVSLWNKQSMGDFNTHRNMILKLVVRFFPAVAIYVY